MSTFEPATLICSCGTEFEVMAADGLHITNLPEVREAILRGEFHVFPCPSCGARVQLDKLLAYTDFDRWHWFTVFPEVALDTWRDAVRFAEDAFTRTVITRSAPIVKTWAPRFDQHRRAVFGVHALREKLRVIDAGLDDRTLEAVKLDVIRAFGLRMPRGAHLWFDRIDDDQLLLAWALSTGPAAEPARTIPAPLALYQRLALDGAAARALCPTLFDTIAVDCRVAFGQASGMETRA